MHSQSLSCVQLCDLMDCSLPGSSVLGIFSVRILEWVAISASRGSFQSKDQTHVSHVSCIAGGFLTALTREAVYVYLFPIKSKIPITTQKYL